MKICVPTGLSCLWGCAAFVPDCTNTGSGLHPDCSALQTCCATIAALHGASPAAERCPVLRPCSSPWTVFGSPTALEFARHNLVLCITGVHGAGDAAGRRAGLHRAQVRPHPPDAGPGAFRPTHSCLPVKPDDGEIRPTCWCYSIVCKSAAIRLTQAQVRAGLCQGLYGHWSLALHWAKNLSGNTMCLDAQSCPGARLQMPEDSSCADCCAVFKALAAAVSSRTSMSVGGGNGAR